MIKLSIKIKISLVILAVGLLLGLLINAFIYKYLMDTLTSHNVIDSEKISAEQVKEISAVFDKYQLFSKMLGTRTRVEEYLLDQSEERRSELLGIFKEYDEPEEDILSIYLMNREGLTLISTDPSFVNQNYAFRSYFQKAAEGEPFVEAVLGKTSHQLGYYFSYPVEVNSEIIGVLVVKVDEKAINESFGRADSEHGNKSMLTDGLGVVTATNVPERILKSLGPLSIEEADSLHKSKKFLEEKIDSLQYKDVRMAILNYSAPQNILFYDEVDREKEYLFVNKIGNYPFFLVVETSEEEIKETVFEIIETISIYILAVILIFVILGYFLVKKFLISNLLIFNEVAKAIAHGDFSVKSKIIRGDEIGDLARSIDEMAEKLQQARENIEKKVADRTADLQKLNRVLTGRELKMIELKNKIKDLEKKLKNK